MNKEIVDLAKQLIKIPSITGEKDEIGKILEIIKKKLNEFPLTTFDTPIPTLLFSNTTKEERNFKLILNAHVDVVSGKQEQFTPYEKDGRLYGRGAFDMKSAAAVMIVLFKEVAHKIPYKLGLQISTDEEIGGYGVGYQVDNGGLRTEFVLIGEGTNFRIIHQAKARLVLKLTTKGKSAHSGYPWLGDNAIWQMNKILQKIIEKYPIPDKEVQHTVANIIKIETQNEALNKIPADCTAYIEIRFIPQEKDTILQSVMSIIPKNVEVEILRKAIPHYTDPENRYIKLLEQTGKEVLHGNLPLAMAHGASDMDKYMKVGCDGIEFGPVGDGHHGENEWVNIESLNEYYQVLKKFLLQIT